MFQLKAEYLQFSVSEIYGIRPPIACKMTQLMHLYSKYAVVSGRYFTGLFD